MHVTIEINGRQALPVRAIPLLTDWRGLSPDQVAQILAGDSDHRPSFDGLTAYRLHPDGSTEPIPQRWWASWVVRKLQATSDAIKAKQTSHETGYQQWRRESLAQLPAGVFVWRDEFEAAHADEYGPEGMRARGNPEGFDPAPHALDFNPQPDPAIALPHLVLDGFVPVAGAINRGRAGALEWLNAPREELPQEFHDAFALWCEVDAIDRQVRELEITQPVGVTEILTRRAALKELHVERARLLAVLEGKEPPAPPPTPTPVEPPLSAQTTPDPERRLARLRELGGSMKHRSGEWRFTGIARLVASEKAQGRSRSDEKTIRADLKEATQNELEAKRAGFGSGLGQR